MLTLAESITITGKPVHDYLDPSMDVPRVDTGTAQGDVLVLRVPADDEGKALWDRWIAETADLADKAELIRFREAWTGGMAAQVMPKTVVVVASEASSNTHTLHPNRDCFYDRRSAPTPADLVIGVLTVPAGATALLSHQEHGNLEILPGTYEIRRQREFAGEWAFVAD